MRSLVVVLASTITVTAGLLFNSAATPPPGPEPVASSCNLPTAVRSTPREPGKRTKFGPPPPGYIKIVGHAVPGWTPDQVHAPASRDLTWYPLGPRPITGEHWSGRADASGRVVSIAPHPTDPNIVYLASASGGVWKSTNAGASWTPLTDGLSVLNHGAVALDPTNPDIVYVGTGEYTTHSAGDGLFRSTDGGGTWTRIATTTQVGSVCSRIAVDPLNPHRIHVTGNYGYCRSLDGGQTWEARLSSGASDLALDPFNPNTIYVARHGDAVYRSTNGGNTFTKLANGWPTTDVRRIVMGMCRAQPNVLYAAAVNNANGLRGFYKSTNGGNTWVHKPNTPNFPTPQGWYDVFVGADPDDPNTVYAGGVFPTYAVAGVIKSTDGGDSWTDISFDDFGNQVHPDQHAFAFGPGGVLWVGNDGGVWKSLDGGARWINCNATLTLTQNYNIALNPADPAQVMGGTQDNGTVGRELDVFEWPQIVGGDGGFLAYDFADPLRRYTTYVYLTVFRIRGNDFAEITGPWENDARDFIAPLVMSPTDSRTLYGGTNRLWRTNNADTAGTCTAISSTQISGGGTLTAIGLCAGEPRTIYTGSSNGAVYLSVDDGAPWWYRSAGLPGGQVSDIVVNPADGTNAYIAFYNAQGRRVLYTGNYGSAWGDVTGTLPTGVVATALAVDWRFNPPGLFVCSGAGVYWSYDLGQHWTKNGSDLPNVNIGDLAIDTVNNTITAGTYGRGAWRAALPPLLNYGDLNCDGVLDAADIDAFVLALTDSAAYEAMYPGCEILRADCNHDGAVDFDDVGPFVALLNL